MNATAGRSNTPLSPADSDTANPHTPRSLHVLPSTEFTFSFTPSTAGRPTPGSRDSERADSNSEATERLSALSQARESTTETTRALFETINLGSSPRQASRAASGLTHEGIQNSNLTPNRGVSTYGDLYNATPSPGPSPSSGPSRGVASPLSSRVGSVTSGIRALGVRDESEGEDEVQSIDDDTLSENETGDDDDESVYSVRQEELPPAPIYDIRLQNALRRVRGELTELTNTMGRSELARNKESNLYDLHRNIELASRFECPESRTVGFIGDSGAGKSTLINSLLDQDGLARSAGEGAACTSVVTEFRNVDDNHPGPYFIEADYMTQEEIADLLDELLRSFRRFHTKEYEYDKVQDAGEKERIKLSALRAWETFESMFPDRLENELNTEFLSNEAPGATEAILSRLRNWAMAGLIHRPGGPDTDGYSNSASNINECKSILRKLAADSPDRQQPAVWPFVKLIRVYLKSIILRTGLVLADLPGFRDLNFARVRATERYLRHSCDEVFIVSTIARCSTDPSIRAIANRCVRDQPLRIVCTRSEDVNPQETPEESPVFGQIQQLLGQREEIKKAIRRTSSRRLKAAGSKASRYALEEARLNDERALIEFRIQQLSIERRNETVTRSLRQKVSEEVRIFCVSNPLYMHHREDNGPHAPEYIRLSGIPDLRRYCQSVPAEAQLRATSVFLENRVPAILGSITQWSLAGSDAVTVDRAETLRRTLTEAQRTLQTSLSSRSSHMRMAKVVLKTQFDTSIIRTCRNSQNRWTAVAVQKCQEWARLHYSSYSAFCRKYGVHTVKNQHPGCWNQDVLQGAIGPLSRGWDTVLESLTQQQEGVADRVSETFEQVSASLEEHIHLAPRTVENLIDNMSIQERCVQDIIKMSFEELFQRTHRTKLDTVDGHDTSYIAELMRPAYNACSAESGSHSHVRRKEKMSRHIQHSQIFMKFSNLIQSDYNRVLDEVFTELEESMVGEVRNILRDLDTAITFEGEVTEAGQFPALVERIREHIAQIQQCLGEAQRIIRELRRNDVN